MCLCARVLVGVSKLPMAIPIQSRCVGSQNRDDPHREQKPRRTFADDGYQANALSPRMVSAALGTSVDAN